MRAGEYVLPTQSGNPKVQIQLHKADIGLGAFKMLSTKVLPHISSNR